MNSKKIVKKPNPPQQSSEVIHYLYIVIQHTYIKKSKQIASNDCSSDDDLSDSFEKIEKAKFNIALNSEVETIFNEVNNTTENTSLTAIQSDSINKKLFSNKEMIYAFCSSILQRISIILKTKKDNIFLNPRKRELKDNYIELKLHFKNIIRMETDVDMKNFIIHNNMFYRVQRFCLENEAQIEGLFKELLSIYNSINAVSKRLDDIFTNPMIIIKEVFQVEFTMNDLYIEEFFNVVIKDEFFNGLIFDIKQREDIHNFKQSESIIDKIYNEINAGKKISRDLKNWSRKLVIEDISHCGLGDMRDDVEKLNDFLIKASE
jgi:hypothetical protein